MKSTALLLFLFVTSFIFAQEGKINGLILDGEFNNEPLAFVTVTVKGASDEVSTNLDGEYSLQLDPGTYTLVFDFVGYESKEVKNVIVEKENLRINDEVLHARKMEMKITSIDWPSPRK